VNIRLAIVNDYEVVVRGLADMLSSVGEDIEVVELNAQTPVRSHVDIALYDTFAQPQGDSPEVEALVANPLVDKVVVYTWNIDPVLVKNTLGHGVAAYLSKTLKADELVQALKEVYAGQHVVSPDPGEAPLVAGDWPGCDEGLTPREAEVIALITQGYSNLEIADKSCLSINSVKSYIRTSYRKIGVTSRTNAVLWGIENGFAPDRLRVKADGDG
jgi:NarL family two-component system response regulator LiaR